VVALAPLTTGGTTVASAPSGAALPLSPVVPGTPVVAPSAAPVVPNLYLPAGARTEAEAMLTLIRKDLAAYREPSRQSEAAPFVLTEGDQVRPLTRLRNDADFDWIKFERDGKAWWAQAEYFIRVDPRNAVGAGGSNLAVGEEAVDQQSALPPRYKPDDMVPVPSRLVTAHKEIVVRRDVADAAARMLRAAEKDGVSLRIFSGFRDFDYQKNLYLEALDKQGPKQDSVAEPGHSEHQLGTTIDVTAQGARDFFSARFGETAEGRWLSDNAARFGFRFSYTRENQDASGYRPEPWHIRFMGEEAATQSGATRVAGK
jgi:hypothetical protein